MAGRERPTEVGKLAAIGGEAEFYKGVKLW